MSTQYRIDTIINVSESNLLELIERLGGLARTDRRDSGKPIGLQPVHLEILSYLVRCNRYSNTPAAVTDYVGATKGTVSQSLQVLERQGYVRKRSDPGDGRVVRLFVMRKGSRLVESGEELSHWNAAFETLSDREQHAAARLLATVLTKLQTSRGGRTFGQCRTCRHLKTRSAARLECGLTEEALTPAETLKICHEHEPPAA